MMRFPWVVVPWAVLLFAAAGAPAPARGAAPDTVAAVELASPHRLPEALVRSAIGDLAGRPRSREAIRESLDRLWALGLFAELWVEELPDPAGVRLRYHLVRWPFLRRLAWEGDAGLSAAEAAAAAALAVGDDAGPERLEEARQSLLAWYVREGFFGAAVQIQAAEDPATNARDVTVRLRAGAQARIGEVRIRGKTRTPAAELTQRFGLRPKDRYREAEATQGLRAVEERLRQAGFFEAQVSLGKPAWDPATNRVDLDLTVVEGPLFQLEFAGNQALKEDALRERLTFAAAGVVDDIEARTSARALEAAYREDGYHFAQAAGVLDRDSDPPRIRFAIQEGPRVRVGSVTVTGNQAFPADRLLGLLETRPPGFLRRGWFRQEVLDQDLQVLLAFYRSRGFPQAAVGPAEVRFATDRTRADILIPLVEGPRLTVGRVALEGALLLPPDELLAALPVAPGAAWDEGRAGEGRRVLERLYARQGYGGAVVETAVVTRDATVDLTYRIHEGDQTRIGRILLSGLVLTQERIVLRELPFRPGDPFNPEALLEAERRLTALGLFERVEVGPLKPPPTAFADVRITLREGKPWRLEFGPGYGTEEGFRGFLEVGHDNLFGTGRKLSLREKVSQDVERTDLTYREPWVLGTAWQGEAKLSRERRSEIGFELDRVGGALGIQRELFPKRVPGLHGALRYRLEQVRRFDVDPALASVDVVAGSQLIASLTPALTLDRRDSPVEPKRGSLHLLSLEGGGILLGGEVNFLKSLLETHWFLDWLSPGVLALSGRLGLATPLADTPRLAVEDRFFAGGGNSIRGYRENRVGPRDAAGNPAGGEALVVLNAEWRLPIWKWLSGALFVDSGTVTPTVSDLGSPAFKTGVGAGLRLSTPVGPIRFDVGYGLNRIPNEDPWQFYFSVGYPF